MPCRLSFETLHFCGQLIDWWPLNTVAGIDAFLDRGLVADIFRMERAFALLEAIGTNANRLNSPAAGNFGELFGAFQTALTSECILAAARLFDRPNPRFPTRCVRYVLDHLRDHAAELPPIREPYQLGVTLQATGHGDLVQYIEAGSAPFAHRLVDSFEQRLATAEALATLEALKTIRDKAIAHNEHVEAVVGPTWADLKQLVAHAKALVGVLGWAWLGTAYDINGEFTLSADASRARNAFNRLLVRLEPAAT